MTHTPPNPELAERHALAERIRQALIDSALAAHDDAGIRGLCCEGAWEAAVTAMRGMDLAPIIAAGSLSLGADSGD